VDVHLPHLILERGKGDGQASNLAYDGVVNSLLTKLDGLEQYDNVIIFGLTNRLELIDPALQRPGRCEAVLSTII
jgi:vesicle-fusing ATPase